MASIAENWKDFSGARNWAGLLDHPLNTEFRRYLIHYGERVDAIVDAFNDVTASDSYGLSRYPAEYFFMNVNLQNGNPFKYQVTKYFYLQSEGIAEVFGLDLEGSAWIGYVAVTTDEGQRVLGRRDILVCWRGTKSNPERVQNLEVELTPASDIFGAANNPKVHRGFHNAYVAYGEKFKYNKASARTQVRAEVRKLVDMYALKGEEVSITVAGHSLGAALATLNGMDMVANGWNKPSGSDKGFPVTVFAYASPSVGDQGFQDVFNGLTNDLHVLRIRNTYDPVPHGMKNLFPDYRDVGEELEIDSSKSPYLKRPGPIAGAHYLQLYLHGIAGYQGKEEEFQVVVDRDISLLNKPLDVLADKYKIPPKWWAVKNNGMIQMDNGFWKLNDYVPEPPSDDEEIITSLENGNLSPA
ncbi:PHOSPHOLIPASE A1-II 7-LIKE [Salix purpurea]|uniref:Phospholipase A1 n=1 Tax=Salix purpurea TaxID=77065 RepID=A0A9Q0W725_SALPP|nr:PHOSPHOLIPASE A1-II 7-LIKE [Salix purpurea]